jgi:hypothetical protein
MKMISLARNGQSNWTLIKKHDATPAENFAAEEFVRFFAQITGATLPIKDDRTPVGNHEIVIGDGLRSCLEPGIGLSKVGGEGYVYWVGTVHGGEQIYIAGKGIRGTLYGVYCFLEDVFGCRWFTNTLSKIPKRDELVIRPAARNFTPPFNYRKSANVDSDAWQFTVRNRLNSKLRPDPRPEHGYEVEYAIGFVHTIGHLIPDELFDEHPEYFPMDGEEKRFHGEYTQRCLTNPGVLAITIEKVRKAFRENPHAMIASVSQADTFPDKPNNCQCPKCKAIDEEEGCLMGSMLRFVNQVADAVRDEFPDRYIDTLAYRYTRQAPKITKPKNNVIIRLCSIECCFSHPLEKCTEVYTSGGIGVVDSKSFVDDMRSWSAIAPNLHIWDYVVNFVHYPMPHANLHVFAENMRFFAKNHTIGVYPEGSPDVTGSDMAELKSYILAHLQWDLDFDVKKGTDEFVRAYCGDGAGPILRYIDALNAIPEEKGLHMCTYEIPNRAFFTPEFMAFANALFDEAEALAEDSEALERIRYWRMSIRYANLSLYADKMTEEELLAEFVNFFADMKRFGMNSTIEHGNWSRSLVRMKSQIQKQLEAASPARKE